MRHSTQWIMTGMFVAAVAALALALPVVAGGWAVVTLDELPGQVAAGEPLEVGFMIRQHGHAPWRYDKVTVHARRVSGGERLTVVARPDGAEGHYVAMLNFPQGGTWNWSIASGLLPERQPMPALTVLPADGAGDLTDGAGGNTSSTVPSLPAVFAGLGLIGALAGLVALVRTRAPWGAAVMLVAAVVGGVGFASGANRAAEPEAQTSAPAPTQIDVGRQLFIAKGCVVCHAHDAVRDVRREISFELDNAPNLTNFNAGPAYLALWLADPASVKPAAAMPKLGLSDGEVAALIAFINSDE